MWKHLIFAIAGLASLVTPSAQSAIKAGPPASIEMTTSAPSSSFYGNEPPNPTQNIPANPVLAPTTFSGTSLPPCYQYPTTQQCDNLAIEAINNAHSVEGVPPISLPNNFSSLPDYIKQFIIVNLERISRGEPPIVGVMASLDAAAQTAASQYHSDPVLSGSVSFAYASNWSGAYGGAAGALVSDYGYMYEDGWGGSVSNTSNYDCTSPSASGCWGHRDNILWNPGVPLSMGAAEASWGNGYYNSTQIFAEASPSSATGYLYTWSQYLQSIGQSQSSPGSSSSSCSPSVSVAAGAAADPYGGGWVVGRSGNIVTQGGAPCYGSLSGMHLNAPIVGITATPDGGGYWLVAADGGIFTFGDAAFYGSMGGKPLNQPVVGMASTPDGKGYWLVAADGGIFTFGDAAFYGSMGGKPLNQPVMGMAADPSTGGYWEVASDGGIFSFNSPFFGSMGGKPLNQPVVGIDALSNGQGYRFVASDGGVFDFGAADFLGSMGGKPLTAPIVGMALNGTGYWLVGRNGAIYSY